MKCFTVSSESLENPLYPTYYRYQEIIKKFEKIKGSKSFYLGAEGALEVLTDGEHSGQTFLPAGAMFIKNGCVKRYNISEFDGFYISEKKNEQLKRSKLQYQDVLFTTIGKYLGVSAVVDKEVAGANINQNVVRMRVGSKFTNPYYLSCFLNSSVCRHQINALFIGNTHPILTYPKIKSIKVVIPNKKIEKTVSEMMQKAEELQRESIRKITSAIKLFDNTLDIKPFKKPTKFFNVTSSQVLGEDMLSPAYFTPEYQKIIDQIKKKYKYKSLGDIAEFKSGDEVGSANYKLYSDRSNTDVPFIRTTDILNFEIDRFPDFFIDEQVQSKFNQDIQSGEIVFSKDGKIGLTAILTDSDKCILGTGLLRVVPNCDEMSSYYLFAALSSNYVGQIQAKQRTVIAATLPHLRVDRVADFVIPILPNMAKIANLAKKGFELREERKVLLDGAREALEDSFDIL